MSDLPAYTTSARATRKPNFAALSGKQIAAAMSKEQKAYARAALGITGPKASDPTPRNRVQIVAHAVANRADCKGKAAQALNLLADDEYANLSGNALVKILAFADGQGSAKEAARAGMAAVLRANEKLSAGQASGDDADSWKRAIAKVNELNGFSA